MSLGKVGRLKVLQCLIKLVTHVPTSPCLPHKQTFRLCGTNKTEVSGLSTQMQAWAEMGYIYEKNNITTNHIKGKKKEYCITISQNN